MEYTLRPLCAKDIFPMMKIISKIGISEFKSCFESDEIRAAVTAANKENCSDAAVSAVGISAMLGVAEILFANIPKCEKELYSLLASVSGLKPGEIQELGMAEFMDMLVEFVKKEEFRDFFGVALKLFKPGTLKPLT